jgi:hypothetical protein
MDGIQPQSSEAPKIAFVDGQFVNQGAQNQEAVSLADKVNKVAEAGAEIAAANPFDVAKEPEISEATTESNNLVNDFINDANAAGVGLTEMAAEPSTPVTPEVTISEPATEIEEAPELPQTPPNFDKVGEIADTAWADDATEKTPVVEEKIETPTFDELGKDPEEILEEINEGFDSMAQKLDSYLETIDAKKMEIKEAISSMEAELEDKTRETKEAIKAKNAEASDLTRKEEMAQAQKKRIMLVQNPNEETKH